MFRGKEKFIVEIFSSPFDCLTCELLSTWEGKSRNAKSQTCGNITQKMTENNKKREALLVLVGFSDYFFFKEKCIPPKDDR